MSRFLWFTVYILDAVPAVHVVWNHVDTDGGTFTSSSARLSTANHVKARQLLIERAVT